MTPVETVGWVATLAVGLAMGLLGGGGSILTVPVLVYLFGVRATVATGDSLFVVGVTALAGAFVAFRQGLIDVRKAAAFALPSTLTVFVVRRWLVPAIPDRIGAFTKDQATILLFAGLMAAAAVAMLRHRPGDRQPAAHRPVLLGAVGVGVGVLAGLVGAGGGFMIVPALALFAGIPMRRSIATSLAVIAVQSLVGFVGEVARPEPIRWPSVLAVTAVSLAGVAAGRAISSRVPGSRLRPAFAWFVLAMAFVLAGNELLLPSRTIEAPSGQTW